jgi:hypothetical protein
MAVTYNHNETVLKEDPRAQLGGVKNHNETVVADRRARSSMTYNHNETVVPSLAYNHNESVLRNRGTQINHNETVVADENGSTTGSRVRPLVRRTAVKLAVAALVAGLLGFGSSPGVAFGTDGVGGSPGGVVLAAGGCSSGTHVPDVDLA